MYTLVQFQEDHIYYICQTSCLRKKKKGIEVKWMDHRYYSANVITYHKSRRLLESIRNNLLHKYPIIVLSKLFTVHGKLTPIKSNVQKDCSINLEVSASSQSENFGLDTDCVATKNNYKLNRLSSSVENEIPCLGQISATDIEKCHFKNSLFNEVELQNVIVEHNYVFNETPPSVDVKASDSTIRISEQSYSSDFDVMKDKVVLPNVPNENCVKANINQISDSVTETSHQTHFQDLTLENEVIIVDMTDEDLIVSDLVQTSNGTEAATNQMNDTAIEGSDKSHNNNYDIEMDDNIVNKSYISYDTNVHLAGISQQTFSTNQFVEIQDEIVLDDVTNGYNCEMYSFENVASQQLNYSAIETALTCIKLVVV
ncbi:hypothetical protein RN001_002898 [Aquatica leii]|uniref:Uncharacterized protein n=1 Tax=Aquatica leii TaxID=1421715 RepID=A0AAN7Q912_9COLE|nr:hypothetical protein RN001_002898 [Aquatica leii]